MSFMVIVRTLDKKKFIIQNSQFIIMITDANYGLSLQSTRQLVNLSTRQLRIMITDVNCNLSLQLTCQLINLSTKNY